MAKQIHQMTVAQFEALFPNEDACDAYLVAHRWPDGVHCPRCASDRIYPLKTMKWKWECPDCREGGAYRFSHLIGTIFENTNIDLRQWFRVMHFLLTSKKALTARQIHHDMGFGSYKTAWRMCHRIRTALQDEEFKKLLGIVEVEETCVGDKAKNRSRASPAAKERARSGSGKTAVVGAISRKAALSCDRRPARRR
jgi:Transposase zinc-ribbon domain